MTAFVTDVCPDCGNLVSVCSSEDFTGYPQRRMCYSTASLQLTRRRLQKKYAKKQPGTDGLHPTDGMSVWISTDDLTPDDDFV